MTFIQDHIDANIHHVLRNLRPAGYVKQFAPTEWKAFDAEGKFLGWFTSKKLAAGAL